MSTDRPTPDPADAAPAPQATPSSQPAQPTPAAQPAQVMSDEPLEPGELAREAALAALARARAAARAKGLRPGMAPARRRRRPDEAAYSGTRVDPIGGRDPALLGDQLRHLLAQRGWQTEVAVGSVMGRWAQIVGPAIAEHTEPLTYTDGALTVRTSSTAWATNLRLQASSLIARLNAEIGPDAVTDLRFVGPNAPSWRRGQRSATDGRGPRDTYG